MGLAVMIHYLAEQWREIKQLIDNNSQNPDR